ncbi:MAG: hypothetical protein JXA68_04325 [Ignavibacteriales bacterium]|nr:hypothetical protein [Ignavibacteriales bacterium]
MKLWSKNTIVFLMLFYSITALAMPLDSLRKPPNSNEQIQALNFKDTDIKDIMRTVAYDYKTNISFDNNISIKISIALFNLTVFDALKIIAQDNGLQFSYDENRFIITLLKVEPPPPPKVIESEPEINYYEEENKIDVKAHDVEINKFIQRLGEKTGKNFLSNPGTSGKISGTLNNIELKTGLQNFFNNNGYNFLEKDGIFYISLSSYYSNQQQQNNNVSGRYLVSPQDGNITMDVVDVELSRILDDLTYQLNLQMIKLANPNARVTMKCSNIPLDYALYYLFNGTDFTYKKDNNVYIVGAKNANVMNDVKLVKLNYLKIETAEKMYPKNLFPSITYQLSPEHNAFLLSGPTDDIVRVEKMLSEIDHPVPQVLIEALVIDYNTNAMYEFGVSMGTADSMNFTNDKWFPKIDVTVSGGKINQLIEDVGSFTLFGEEINLGKIIKLPENFYANVKALEQNGLANVRARPLLSTLNGNKASLEIGSTQQYIFKDIQPYGNYTQPNYTNHGYLERETVQKIEALIKFEITPFVGPNNELTLEIKPDFQTPSGTFDYEKRLMPTINKQSLSSTVRLKNGETIILGGLIKEGETTTKDKFPILGDIPIIGDLLFTSTKEVKTKSELIIYLTPRIFYDNEVGYSYYEGAE